MSVTTFSKKVRNFFQYVKFGRTGLLMATISLPPGKKGTCVGATPYCCGNHGNTKFIECSQQRTRGSVPCVKAYRQRMYNQSLLKNFVPNIMRELKRRKPDIVRIHASGDFYSLAYILKWVAIIAACPDIKFLTYTRSWRVPELLVPLTELAAFSNISMFFSADCDSDVINGEPPIVPNVRVAYQKHAPGSIVPDYVDVIWRDKRNTTHPKFGVYACPRGIYQDKTRPHKTCSTCQVCYTAAESRRERAYNGSELVWQGS